MQPIADAIANDKDNWEFAEKLKENDKVYNTNSVKGSQFAKPLFEFSGACAGCGETPYVKLVTQLFGDRMIVANATGCSSIYGGSAPTCPYTKNDAGHGPAWANSLFEDNAEYGYGMNLAIEKRRETIAEDLTALKGKSSDEALVAAADAWIASMNDAEESKKASFELLKVLVEESKKNGETKELADRILSQKDCLVKKSIWIIGR